MQTLVPAQTHSLVPSAEVIALLNLMYSIIMHFLSFTEEKIGSVGGVFLITVDFLNVYTACIYP